MSIDKTIQLKLDFRFADEEDIEEIKELVNVDYIHEEDRDGNQGFRPEGDPKIGISELIDDMDSPSTRWIVLETPRPEEIIVAALRISVERRSEDESSLAIIDLFSCQEPSGQFIVRNMILKRAEAVCSSLCCEKIVFKIPHWSEERQNWIESRGYVDCGGHAWPEDRLDEITRHTMLLSFQKSLVFNDNQPTDSKIPSIPLPEPFLNDCEIVDAPIQENNANSDPMLPLISDLFSALHAEYEGKDVDPNDDNSRNLADQSHGVPQGSSMMDLIGKIGDIALNAQNESR